MVTRCLNSNNDNHKSGGSVNSNNDNHKSGGSVNSNDNHKSGGSVNSNDNHKSGGSVLDRESHSYVIFNKHGAKGQESHAWEGPRRLPASRKVFKSIVSIW
ncbi:hypothetical protein Bpfe_010781 [Biomphalaria pfeifferi]|uniref:Uncharacterized protein n=1 Tax=Biomphalaria pfeifferi TaxID=112525 RepID=A0AAD8BS96_BIOPF|nr:hypothetical protein Bpfe_010781 [Biomphalaria pfeifferi]